MLGIEDRCRSGRRRRSGFTLIELLVVIAIIAALMALSASAVIKFMAVQQNNNTQTVMNKVQSALNKQWAAAKDQAWKEPIPSAIDTYIRQNLAGNDANVTGRVRVIYVKLKMRQLFPMNFNEALNPAPLPGLPAYQQYLSQLGVTGSIPANYESSACLLMALNSAQSGGGTNTADIGGGGSTISFTLPSGKSISAFADAWGQPLYFTRVPAGCSLVNANPVVPGGGTPGIHDPGDRQGYLNSQAWPKTANTKLFTQLTLQPLAATNSSYKLVPMLASGGPNKILEVDPIWFSGVYTDDVFSNP
jgi:prepilin-type N-terminal cleavage/methylation domain-containing protein